MTLFIDNLLDIAKRYDAFLIDQFGVLLNSQGAYSFAPYALKQLADMGKRIVLLSNSGRRSKQNFSRLVAFGFAPESFEIVLTSGEVAFRQLESRIGKKIEPGAKIFIVSRDGDTSSIDGLPVKQTGNPDEADLIILAGNQSDDMELVTYENLLKSAAQRNVPCFCTNPDMVLLTPDGTTFSSGRIALLYQNLGGKVEWIGKPYPLIYDVAYKILNRPERDRVLCIGDSLSHDIAGGIKAGFATSLVLTGIQTQVTEEKLKAKIRKKKITPNYILSKFSFS